MQIDENCLINKKKANTSDISKQEEGVLWWRQRAALEEVKEFVV